MASLSRHPLLASEIEPTVSDSVYRLNIHQYHRMTETGILSSGSPIELLDGLLVEKRRPTGTIHRLSVEQYPKWWKSGF